TSARSASKAYTEELETQHQKFKERLNDDLEAVGKRFAAALRSAATQIRVESSAAVDNAFETVRANMEKVFTAMISRLAERVEEAATRADASATHARESSDAITASFERIEGKLTDFRSNVETSIDAILTAYERHINLIIDKSARDSILANSWHENAVAHELA